MGLPFSKNQVRRLGDRPRAASAPSETDLDQLHELLTAYDEALLVGVTAVRNELNLSASPRLKNTGTIIEKLRRNRTGTLGNIQDLAGMRIVLDDNDRDEQDRVCDALVDHFSKENPMPRVTDRRITPVQGYRAVHVIVHIDSLPIEIQVRTPLQHDWAEYFEKLGDHFGREIRYGEPLNPDHFLRRFSLPEQYIDTGRLDLTATVESLVQTAQLMSDMINYYENAWTQVKRSTPDRDSVDRIKELGDQIERILNAANRAFDALVTRFHNLVN